MDARIPRGNSNRYQARLIAGALLAVLGLVVAGCGGSSASAPSPGGVAAARHSTSSAVVRTRKISGLGLDRNPAGGKVVTYSRWPLYAYAGDSAAGQANGENLNQNGAKWYVISPKGRLVEHRS